MNLIERARNWTTCLSEGAIRNAPVQTKALLEELAGEVERLWAFEKEYTEVLLPSWEATAKLIHERRRNLEAEVVQLHEDVERAHASADTKAVMAAWNDGFVTAARAFSDIMGTLLRAIPPRPVIEEPHEHLHL